MNLYLDFDGVIADTANECIESTIRIWQESNKNLEFQIDKKIYLDQLFNLAITYRYLVVHPEHFLVLIDTIAKTILDEKNIEEEKISKAFISNINLYESNHAKELEEFKLKLFDSRSKSIKNSSCHEWVKMNPATRFWNELINSDFINIFNLKIISRKDENSISKWIEAFNINELEIYSNDILSKNISKFDHIKKLQNKSDFKKSYFIDDKRYEFNGGNWDSINVITVHAGWGYNDSKDNTDSVLKILSLEVS